VNNAPLVDRLGVTAISTALYVDECRVDLNYQKSVILRDLIHGA
jgi:hypothetical protein